MEDLKKSFLVRGSNIVGAVGDKNFSTLPIGCIAPYLGRTDNIPRGYLFADGSSYKTTDYPELFNIIGYTYGGSGDTFNVPNLSDGRFLEGSIISGGYVNAGLPNITGELVSLNAGTSNFKDTEFVNGAFSPQAKWNTINGSGNMDSYGEVSFDASKSNPIYGNSDTVQPKSLMVLYIIKAFHTNEGVDSGVSDDVVEYVDNYVDNSNSYSTEETLTGGKWIDGKPIYRKCFSGNWTVPNSTWTDIITVPNVKQLIRTEMIGNKKKWDGYWEIDTNNSVRFYTPNGTNFNLCILEYTKTTD